MTSPTKLSLQLIYILFLMFFGASTAGLKIASYFGISGLIGTAIMVAAVIPALSILTRWHKVVVESQNAR